MRASNAVAIAERRSGLFTNAAGSGADGDILLQARGIQLTDGAVISAKSTGEGDAGMIRIADTQRFLSTKSAVTTEAAQAGGGGIELEAHMVRLLGSALTAEAMGAAEVSGGGNVAVSAAFVVLNGSQVRANAFGGAGGNIQIEATEAFLTSADSLLDASSQLGLQGTVDIQASIANLSGTVAPLPQTFVPAAALLRQRCAERLQEGMASSFVHTGRDRLPIEPGGILPSPLYVEGPSVAKPATPGKYRQDTPASRTSPHGTDTARQSQVQRRQAPHRSRIALDWEYTMRRGSRTIRQEHVK